MDIESQEANEIPLTGGRATPGVVRVGDTVRRPVLEDADFRHLLLRHLERVGFEDAPRLIGTDAKGREILSFIEGEVPTDFMHHDDDTICMAAALLRRFHDATAGSPLAGGEETVCHNDYGPANVVFRGGRPAAIIDFDTAAPGPRLWDLGQSAWDWLELGHDTYTGAEQRRRLALFAAAYDWPAATPAAIAVYAVARQAALAAWSRCTGDAEGEAWAQHSADWTARHLLQPGIPVSMR